MEGQSSRQKSEDQQTYTIQETSDQKTYTVESETDEKLVRKISGFSSVPTVLDPELISVCACLINSDSDLIEDTPGSERKQRIFSNCLRTETYLRERRIPDLIRFILTKIMCNNPVNVGQYIADLLDDCMIFRSGLGKAPVLFEKRHLEAVVRSFDPCNRGWLSAGQVRRACTTLGLTPKSDLEAKIPTREVLEILRGTQESELFSLVTAGSETENEFYDN